MGRKAYEQFTCTCGERCVMVPNEKSGKLAPITSATYETGNIVLIQATDNGPNYAYRALGKPEDRAANAGQLYLNHWSNCPHAADFRRR
jgi:hypothetical protein